MTRLRLAFMGTPAYAVPTLDALLASRHEVARVYTQPARAAGRGHRPRPTPVALRAEAAGLPIETPRHLDGADAGAALAALGCDLGVTVAYGLILPKGWLAAPRLGFVNAHASLLPRWRGAAPIQRAIMAGDTKTGVTIMRMDEGLDTGPVLLAERVPIGPAATAGALHDALAALSARLLLAAVDGLAAGALPATPQAADGATYAAKIEKREAAIDWRAPASRAWCAHWRLRPAPGSPMAANASSFWRRKRRRRPVGRCRELSSTRHRPSPAARARRSARRASSGPARRRWRRTPSSAAAPSRREPACRAPLQADRRI